jgi:hypothetical protein
VKNMLEFYNLHNVCSKSWVSSVESKLLAIEIDNGEYLSIMKLHKQEKEEINSERTRFLRQIFILKDCLNLQCLPIKDVQWPNLDVVLNQLGSRQ